MLSSIKYVLTTVGVHLPEQCKTRLPGREMFFIPSSTFDCIEACPVLFFLVTRHKSYGWFLTSSDPGLSPAICGLLKGEG